VKEVLTAYDKDSKTMKYDITESVLPVREYSATILVQSADGKTTVTWRSMFKRKDPANPGAPGQDDKAAKDAITGIFKAGLENLKKISEQK
jgi:mxaD protein